MAIIRPLIACKDRSKFSRGSADFAILRGKSPQNPAINKKQINPMAASLVTGRLFLVFRECSLKKTSIL